MDSKLLDKIYGMYKRELYLYIFSLCRNKELTEDLLQETFLKALLSLSSQHTNVRAWLYVVARNLYFNYCKKEKSKESVEEIRDLVAQGSDVAEQAVADDRKHALYEAMQRLAREKREVLVLQYFVGLSQKEIATILRVSPENVRVLGYRAKKELKKLMEAKGYDI